MRSIYYRLSKTIALHRHRLHYVATAHELDHSFKVVSQDMQTHFCTDVLFGFGEEVRRTHPTLECAKGMFNGASSDLHGIRYDF